MYAKCTSAHDVACWFPSYKRIDDPRVSMIICAYPVQFKRKPDALRQGAMHMLDSEVFCACKVFCYHQEVYYAALQGS